MLQHLFNAVHESQTDSDWVHQSMQRNYGSMFMKPLCLVQYLTGCTFVFQNIQTKEMSTGWSHIYVITCVSIWRSSISCKPNYRICRMIQVERESADLRSDEIEARVNSGSMDGLNVTLRPRALPTSATAQSLASSCSPPNSGHSTPKHHSRNASHHLGIMTLVREYTQTCNCVFCLFFFLQNFVCIMFPFVWQPSDLRKHRRKVAVSLQARNICSNVGFCDRSELFWCFFFSLLWKWTKLLSSVRHRRHHPHAVYAWNPTLPSSQEAWRMDEGKHTHRQHSGAQHQV